MTSVRQAREERLSEYAVETRDDREAAAALFDAIRADGTEELNRH